jgi:hypothetical protein
MASSGSKERREYRDDLLRYNVEFHNLSNSSKKENKGHVESDCKRAHSRKSKKGRFLEKLWEANTIDLMRLNDASLYELFESILDVVSTST